MATPRRPYILLDDAILREPLTDTLLATRVRLMAWLHTRWARDRLTAEQACTAVVSRGALHEITGRAQLVHARRVLRELAEIDARTPSARDASESLVIRELGEFTEISWPNFSDSQGLASRDRATDGRRRASPTPPPDPVPVPVPVPDPLNETRESAPAGAAARASRSRAPRAEPPAWALAGADALLEHVRRQPGGRLPSGARARWAAELARLPAEVPELARGEPGPAILDAIAWLGSPANAGEYAIVVHSGGALRDKWPKIAAARARARVRENGAARVSSQRPPARAVAETAAPIASEELREREAVDRLRTRYRLPSGRGVPTELVSLALAGATEQLLDTHAARLGLRAQEDAA